jgi:hypothetical protein
MRHDPGVIVIARSIGKGANMNDCQRRRQQPFKSQPIASSIHNRLEEHAMRRLIVLTIAAFLAIGAALLPSRGNALPLAAAAADVRLTTDSLNLVEKAQWAWGGRRFCFYPTGWHGPGWYWCGYAWRRGLGWGGVYGWRGWRHPRYHTRFAVRPRVVRPRARVVRPRAGVRSRPAVRSRPGVRTRTTVRSRPSVRSRTTVRPRATVGSRPAARSRSGGRRGR